MSVFSIPVRRPVATSMLFVGIVVLGAVAWQRIPVELFPQVEGDTLTVSFLRPGSDPELVEREILLPLQARVSELPGVEETWGEINGASGTFRARFRPGADLDVRELDLHRLAAELTREQPPGTVIRALPDPATIALNSGFAMFVQVSGMEDRNSLLDFVDERVVPRLAAVPGVSQVLATGGAPLEVTVLLDPDRAAALGVTPGEVTSMLARAVQRLDYLGGAEDEAGRTAVLLDGRPQGLVSLGNLRVRDDRPVLLRHVARIERGTGREESQYRVDGRPAVGLIVFQEEGANLVRLSRNLRARVDRLGAEFGAYGLNFNVNFDGGEVIQDQMDRLQTLALSGFVIALAVLFLFLRQFRAVGVVGLAVPASLLCALVLLFVAGQSLNVITLFGLAVGIGMLVDNSIVVYEAVQRQLEHGASPDAAAETGVRRTVRAILASTATNAVVFLPISFVDFDQAALRSALQVLVLAILLPLIGSLLVAVGLVPLLARHMAAPAARARIRADLVRRRTMGGWSPPDRARELFGGFLKSALRRPTGWITAIVVAVVLTVLIALPLVTLSTVTQEAPETTQVRLPVEVRDSGSLQATIKLFERLESAALSLSEGVERVESFVQEGSGNLTIHMKPRDERPADINAARVRAAVRAEAAKLDGVEITTESAGAGGGGGGGLGGLLGSEPTQAVISGPDSRTLERLGDRLAETLDLIPEVGEAKVTSRTGADEIHVTPDLRALRAFGLTADQVLPVLQVARREGVAMRIGFTLPDGREIPLTVRRDDATEARNANAELERLRLETAAGVLTLGEVAEVRKAAPPPTIAHHNGRREIAVAYSLDDSAPQSGPARNALEAEIRKAISGIHRPAGYTVEAPEPEEGIAWFKTILVPVILLLFAVLAVTFESLTLPVLILVSLPLTLLGATWALVFSGTPASPMALMGAVALIGLTVNPAILLVDRMQHHARLGGLSAGAAALAAVRERARPVLMTATTTIAGLWPLALTTGAENEIWPPFATIVMGGLITSTVLTLLAIPVGFVFLNRLDRTFGRLGPYVVLAWLGATLLTVGPLFWFGAIESMTWQIVTSLLVAGGWLGVAAGVLRRVELPRPRAEQGGAPALSVRYLTKVYGRPGPVGRAWRVWDRFAARVRGAGGTLLVPRDAAGAILPWALVLAGALYLAASLQTFFWRMVFVFLAAGVGANVLSAIRRARGKADAAGRTIPGPPESAISFVLPWIATGWILGQAWLLPTLSGEPAAVREWFVWALPPLVALAQAGRRTAVRIAHGMPVVATGRLARLRGLWRRFARVTFGLDLPREEVRALTAVHFEARRGMIGILGPNGAGKTTLLRLLSGILDPSVGVVALGGVPLGRLRKYLARWIGYLPQDFGLPDDLTAREYLEYFALLYEIRPAAERRARVERLLEEVGLKDKADGKIGGYSGGMRQRVAVARTLLRLPPLIIVDEPTVGLDPRERIRFRNLLARLSEGRIVLFSTHVVEDVEVACERVLVMARGRKVFDDEPDKLSEAARGRVWRAVLTPEELAELPADALVVDEVPLMDGTVRARILCRRAPHPAAESIDPGLEDGYLWLVEVEGRDAPAAA